MLPTSRLTDIGDHGGEIITASETRFVSGLPAARLGDIFMCRRHGPRKIVNVAGGPHCDAVGRITAHVGAMAECGAYIITGADMFQGVIEVGSIAGVEAELAALEDDPDSDTGPAVYPRGGANTAYNRARQRALFGDPPGAPLDTNDTSPEPVDETPISCGDVSNNPSPGFRLSPNFTLAQLSTSARFPHAIRAQHGLTVPQIVCNLKGVAENILEPLRAKYGNLLITSGFRSGGGPSQHERGQAVDVQFPGANNEVIWERAQWVKDNIPYDQFILEYLTVRSGGRPWFHLSFKQSGSNRRDVRTAEYPGQYPQGLRRVA